MFENYISSLNNTCITQTLNAKKYFSDEYCLKELNILQDQGQLLQKIHSRLFKQKQSCLVNIQSVQSDFQQPMKKSQSMISIFSLSYDLNSYHSCIYDRKKFGTQENKSLYEIKQKCTPQTYQYFKKIIFDKKKQNRQQNNSRKLQTSKLETIFQQNTLLKHEKVRLEQQVTKLNEMLKFKSIQINQVYKKKQYIESIEKKLLKKEQNLLYKNKICNNLQKQIRKQLIKMQQLCEKYKQRKNCSNHCQKTGNIDFYIENEEQQCVNESKSTIDEQSGRSQTLNQLWVLLNKLEKINEKNNERYQIKRQN